MGGDKSCKYCGSFDVEYSDARGETICCQCGAVLEENSMVEGLQFMENSGGSVTMVGQFIPTSGGSRGYTAMYSRESREIVLQRGYQNIQWIADRLRLSNQLSESSQRIYLMAVQRNFTMGRNNLLVASACLYIICRRERTPHMLIDFSDVVQSSVRSLGQVFMKLLRLLHIQVPHIDPSLFMERFASQMSLGDKLNSVAFTGVRLIQVMTRDWICTGRRPTGLCGSALLISARYHGFRINAEDISHIVRIGSPTLMRRLSEFQHTQAAQLTAEEFESLDLTALPVLVGPPCVEQRKRKLLALPYADTHSDNVIEDDSPKELLPPHPLQGEIAINATRDELCNENPTPADITRLAESMIDAVGKAINERYRDNSDENNLHTTTSTHTHLHTFNLSDPLTELLKDMKEKANELLPELPTHTPPTPTHTPPTHTHTSPTHTHTSPTHTHTSPTHTHTNDHNLVNSSPTHTHTPKGLYNSNPFDLFSLDVVPTPDETKLDLNEDEVETLSDIDESEIYEMLLTEKEQRIKATIWDEITRDIMPEVYRRIKRKREKEDEVDTKSERRKRINTPKKFGESEPAESAADSVRMALQKNGKGIINKINNNVLDSLFSAPSRIVEEASFF